MKTTFLLLLLAIGILFPHGGTVAVVPVRDSDYIFIGPGASAPVAVLAVPEGRREEKPAVEGPKVQPISEGRMVFSERQAVLE